MHSVVTEKMSTVAEEWTSLVAQGAARSTRNIWDEALDCYQKADDLMASVGINCRLNPRLQLLRDRAEVIDFDTSTMTPAPTEDSIVSVQWNSTTPESSSSIGMLDPIINADVMKSSIQEIIENFYPNEHCRENLKNELAHIQVLSTGRCGTVSLFHLIERYQPEMIAYHT